MGTNWYICDHYCESPDHHIGKSSGAGPYCFKCKKTLCKQGEFFIHHGTTEWYSECPVCGEKVPEIKWDKDGNIVEPGNVRGAVSFSWAMDPDVFANLPSNTKIYSDGSDTETYESFKERLSLYPIHYYDGIGMHFC